MKALSILLCTVMGAVGPLSPATAAASGPAGNGASAVSAAGPAARQDALGEEQAASGGRDPAVRRRQRVEFRLVRDKERGGAQQNKDKADKREGKGRAEGEGRGKRPRPRAERSHAQAVQP